MIVVTATGFIGEKPMLISFKNADKVEFDVISSSRIKSGGEWVTQFERATFVAWGEDAIRIAELLDRGQVVTATGVQKTSKWTDDSGQTRSKVRYELMRWERVFMPKPETGVRGDQHGGQAEPVNQRAQTQVHRPPQRFAKPPVDPPGQPSGPEDGPEYLIP